MDKLSNIRTFDLQRLRLAVSAALPVHLRGSRVDSTLLDAQSIEGMATQYLARAVISYWASAKRSVKVAEVPATPWDAFKATWPAWLQRVTRARVNMRPVIVDARLVYSTLEASVPGESFALQVYSPDFGSSALYDVGGMDGGK